MLMPLLRQCLLYVHVLGNTWFFFPGSARSAIYTLSLHDALPIFLGGGDGFGDGGVLGAGEFAAENPLIELLLELRRRRSEEHTSELQSPDHLVCRLLLEKKKGQSKPMPLSEMESGTPFVNRFVVR